MLFSTFGSLAVAQALFSTVSAIPQPQSGDSGSSSACNNSPSLCEREYNRITHFGAHNSPFLRDESTDDSISGNQFYNATEALNGGLRLLQGQIHAGDSPLQLCHSSCDMMDGGPLEDWLSAINVWMEANPNDVVTILLVNQNQDATADDFGQAFNNSGIGQYGFTPEGAGNGPSGEWPTLQSMIDDDKRLVAFVTEVEYSPAAPYILPEFDYVFETHFEVTEISGFNCTLDRPSTAESAEAALGNGMLSLVNHFKYQSIFGAVQVPDVDTLDVVNAPGNSEEGNLGRHLEQCNEEWGSVPNFVLVDFWSQGGGIQAVDAINDIDDVTDREEINEVGAGRSAAAVQSRNFGAGALITFICAAMLLV